jgi:hypothetical protein
MFNSKFVQNNLIYETGESMLYVLKWCCYLEPVNGAKKAQDCQKVIMFSNRYLQIEAVGKALLSRRARTCGFERLTPPKKKTNSVQLVNDNRTTVFVRNFL